MFAVGGLGIFGFFLPRIPKNAAIKRTGNSGADLPRCPRYDVDLRAGRYRAGKQTVDRVALEVGEYAPILAEELGILSAEMAMLNDRRTVCPISGAGRRTWKVRYRLDLGVEQYGHPYRRP